MASFTGTFPRVMCITNYDLQFVRLCVGNEVLELPHILGTWELNTAWKFLSRNCRYRAAGITVLSWLTHHQSYRRAYGTLNHTSCSVVFCVKCVWSTVQRAFLWFMCMQYRLIQGFLIVETHEEEIEEKCRENFVIRLPVFFSVSLQSSMSESWRRPFQIPTLTRQVLCVMRIYKMEDGHACRAFVFAFHLNCLYIVNFWQSV